MRNKEQWRLVQAGRLTFLHGPLEIVQHAVVVNPAEHLLLHQGELLPGGQLPFAGEAGEAGQVVHVSLRPADPVCGVDVPAAARTPRAVPSAGEAHGEHIRHPHSRQRAFQCLRVLFFSAF